LFAPIGALNIQLRILVRRSLFVALAINLGKSCNKAMIADESSVGTCMGAQFLYRFYQPNVL
jgi:hypothetical protein